MIDLSESIKENLLDNSLYREIILRFPDATGDEITEITSSNIVTESFELVNSICDEKEFVMGGCIAGQMKIQVIGIEEALNNKRINVFIRQSYVSGKLYPSSSLYPSSETEPRLLKSTVEVQVFSGVVNSSLRQNNRSIKEIIAYDDLYQASKIKMYNIFSSFAVYGTKLGTIREFIMEQILGSYDYEDEFVGFNDDIKLSLSLDLVKSICDCNLTAFDLLNAYCELNACFAVMTGAGEIKFIQLLNPSIENVNYYSDLTFEEYETRDINLIRFTYNKDQTSIYGFGTDSGSWYVSDNIICRCCTDILNLITNFYDHLNGGQNYIFYDLYKYRPFEADVFARYWIEPGDKVVINTGCSDVPVVESFVFSRTIKGINGMRVKIKADGTEYLGSKEMEDTQQGG